MGKTPEGQANNEQQLNLAMDAVNPMSPRLKEVFILAKLHGLRQKENALKLDIAESTVEKHISKGVAKIALLEDAGGC